MKIQLETISSESARSFSMMYNPRLSDLFYWHFHPEYELVYIQAPSGTRHVGDHISTFKDNDLVLIGSGIPHLNFDYGLKSEYRKVVVHLKKDFIEATLPGIPELQELIPLFELAAHGMAFDDKIREEIGNQLFEFEFLDEFDQYLRLIRLLKQLAESGTYQLLHEKPYEKRYSRRDEGRLRSIYAFVDKNYHRKIELDEIAKLSSMSREAFCRYFKSATSYTFIAFLNRYRVSQAKRHLMMGETVSAACFSCGFESLSYFNRIFKRVTSENPTSFRTRYFVAEKSTDHSTGRQTGNPS